MSAYSCLATWTHKTLPLATDFTDYADVVIAMEFGQGGAEPVQSNVAIARIASHIRKKSGIPVCAQDEAAHCLIAVDSPPNYGVFRDGDYINTEEVVERISAWCHRNGRTRAAIVTHPLHQWRVMRTAQHFGLSAVNVDCKAVACDASSIQEWCRDEASFRRYEVMARMLFLGRGLI